MRVCSVFFVFILSVFLGGCGAENSPAGASGQPEVKVRLGFFANVTHAQAIIGIARGDFQRALGNCKLETKVFNAGPSAVEAFFAGELDLAYIGPGPAVNAFVKSGGKVVRIICGSAANGVCIIVRPNSGIGKLADLAGKRIATPQFWNTQDLSARHYLTKILGLKLSGDGGETEVLPIANADQLNLFRAGQIDATWAPEPWASRLIHEAQGTLLAEEKDLWPKKCFCSVVLLASTKFLNEQPALAQAFLKAHEDLTAWINANSEQAAELVNAELAKPGLTGKALSPAVLKGAFAHTQFTTDPLMETVQEFAAWLNDLAYHKEAPDLKGLFVPQAPKKIAN